MKIFVLKIKTRKEKKNSLQNIKKKVKKNTLVNQMFCDWKIQINSFIILYRIWPPVFNPYNLVEIKILSYIHQLTISLETPLGPHIR